MQSYETVFISPPNISTKELDQLLEKIKAIITKKSGEILKVDQWGRRRLAYPIERQVEGFYVFLLFKASEDVVSELSQFYRLAENVIRQLTCKAVRATPPRLVKTASPSSTTAASATDKDKNPYKKPIVTKEASHAKPPTPTPSK